MNKPFAIFQTDALALASPSGRMSKRALKSAQDRIAQQLFGDLGPSGLKGEGPPQPTECERLLSQAAGLRDLAARGMSVRKFVKKAQRLEALALQPLVSVTNCDGIGKFTSVEQRDAWHQSFEDGRYYWWLYTKLNGFAKYPNEAGLTILSKDLSLKKSDLRRCIQIFLES